MAMSIPGADPKEALKKIADELKQKFDDAGMGAVDTFTNSLDEVKDMVEKGPAKILETMKELFNSFKAKMQEYMDNPASLAPSAGALAACASWYGGSVVGKLGELNKEAEEMLKAIMGMVSQIKEPMEKLGQTLNDAMKTLEDTVKKLAKLPSELTKIAGDVGGPDDVAKIDTDPMKKALDTSGISSPLDALAGLKGPLGDAIDAVKTGVENLIDFIEAVPDKLKAAFDVPTPLCFAQQLLMSQAPEAMTQLMLKVEEMKKLDMSPMKTMLGQVHEHICGLDPSKVSEPVKKFAASAKDSVDNLEKVVSGAKLASGGALTSVAAAVPGWRKKMF